MRCRSTIALGWYPEVGSTPEVTPGLHTRCSVQDEDHEMHEGKGLAEFDYQRWQWFSGDRRCYQSDREDVRAWELA
jgi:hypothetical protein